MKIFETVNATYAARIIIRISNNINESRYKMHCNINYIAISIMMMNLHLISQ